MPQQANHLEKTAFLARLINGLGSVYLRFAPNALPINTDYLHEKAMKDTGLTDFGDPHYLEGLGVLLSDFDKNTKANFIGRLAFQDVLIRQLRNRLRFVEYKKKHPEVFEKPLLAPLLITGIPRSGTTFLHRLMNEDEHWRSLKLYEIQQPIPPAQGQKDKRRSETAKELKPLDLFVPELDSKHLLRADMPEECMWLMGITFCSLEYILEMPLRDYLDWYLQHDRSQAYREYAQLLQIAQAQAPGKPLLLKAPSHRGSLDYLKAVIPNIRLVITKRDRHESAASFSSLLYSALRNNVPVLDKQRLGETVLKLFSCEEERQKTFLAKHPLLSCTALYQQIRLDPLATVSKIYQHYDIPLTREAEEKMQAYAITNPQHQYGVHQYSLNDFGIGLEIHSSGK